MSSYLDLENDPDIDNVGSKDDAINYLALIVDKHHDISPSRTDDVENPSHRKPLQANNQGKKARKRRRVKAGQPTAEETATHYVPIKDTQTAADADDELSPSKAHSAIMISLNKKSQLCKL